MRICILGAGSLGAAMGGILAQANNQVTLVNRNQDFCDAVNKNGLRLTANGKTDPIALQSVASAHGLEAVDLLLVMVKSFHTKQAMSAAVHLVGPQTSVLSLQNGLGHEKILAELIDPGQVIAGKTYVSGQMTAPGQVTAGVGDRETLIGELDGRVSHRISQIAEVFNSAGLKTRVSQNIQGVLWDKLLVNVATGAISGLTGLDYGNLYAIPEITECAIAAVAEAMSIATALGIAIETTDPRETWHQASVGLPFEFKASMLQSLEKGSVTEIDFINGAIVREGRRLGIATPVNQTLVAAIKGKERSLDPQPAPGNAGSAGNLKPRR